jgi:PAS domain S-box-containing protein
VSAPQEPSSALFRLIAEATYDWESWVDARGETRWINAAVERITGFAAGECLARSDYPLFLAHEQDRPLLSRVLADAARAGSGNDVEFRVTRKDGEPRWVAISWQAVRAADGRSLGYRTSVRDIHQRKLLEEELHAIRRRAEALAQARSELLANVSHELRSPLHHIAGFAELLTQEALGERPQRYASLITEQARSMLRQVEDLLSLAALEAGGVELEHAAVDVVALCEGLIEASAQQAAARGLSLTLEVSLGERRLEGDAGRLGQILRNLLDNALKFSERGAVCLRVCERSAAGEPRLVFEVVDSGSGMDPERVESLLLPFHQGDASSGRRHGGVGLGLAIVDRLVRAMRGKLEIESSRGAGTTVRVSLPLARVALPEAALPRGAARTGRALVVDDSPVARELLCELLHGLGFAALEASSPQQARALVSTSDLDVVFLDYQMPGSDGAELALALRRALSARDPARHVPIFILTANVFVHEQLRDARSSVDAILTKPLSRAALGSLLEGLGSERCVAGHPGALDLRVVDDLRATRARGAASMLRKLLPRTEAEMRETLARATQALEREDWDALRREAHAAAGHAALLGAQRARAAAAGLELSLEQPDPSPAAARALLRACAEAWQEASAELQQLAGPVTLDKP